MVIYSNEKGRPARIDVATARLEYYEYPAALPSVELSSIKMDLFRRDFSINALAVRLDCEPFGQLVDFFGGQRDIKERVIRVLHTLSFVEDPTRCLRAVRFEQRYSFHIGAGTEKLIKNALKLKLMDKLSGARLFHEFQHICDEDDPTACIARLDQLGVLEAIAPLLALNPTKRNLLLRLQETLTWYRLLYFELAAQPWLAYFLALNHNLSYADTADHYQRMGLPEPQRADVFRQREHMRMVRGKLESWQTDHEAARAGISALCALLRPLSLEFLLYLMADISNAALQKNISRYITLWRREKADVDGDDLRAMGLQPGPDFGRILGAALAAKLDGIAATREQQLELARGLVRRAAENPAAKIE